MRQYIYLLLLILLNSYLCPNSYLGLYEQEPKKFGGIAQVKGPGGRAHYGEEH